MVEEFEFYDDILGELEALLKKVDGLKQEREKGEADNPDLEARLRELNREIEQLQAKLSKLDEQEPLLEDLTIPNDPDAIEQSIADILEITEATEEANEDVAALESLLGLESKDNVEEAASKSKKREPPQTHHVQEDIPIGQAVDEVLREELKRRKDDEGLELTAGALWFSRVGIVMTLASIGLFIYYILPSIPTIAQVGIGAVVTLALNSLGVRLDRRFPLIGKTIQALGVCAGYFTIFAAFFFPNYALFTSQELGIGLLFAYTVTMYIVAQKLRSQNGAIITMLLGYFTAISFPGMGTIGLILASSNLSITIGLSFRNPGWMALPKISLVAAFATFSFWHWAPSLAGGVGSFLSTVDESIFLWFSYLAFTALILYPKRRGDPMVNMINALGFYVVYRVTQPLIEPAGILELAIAAVLIGSIFVYRKLRQKMDSTILTDSFVILAVIFCAMATLQFCTGIVLAAVLATEALLFGILSKLWKHRWTYNTSTVLFYCLSLCGLMLSMPSASQESALLNFFVTLWIGAVGLGLEHLVFNVWKHWKRLVLLTMVTACYGFALFFGLSGFWDTLAFAATGGSLIALGIVIRKVKYRLLGITWITIAFLALISQDLAPLGRVFQVMAFIIIGVALVAASKWYANFSKHLDE